MPLLPSLCFLDSAYLALVSKKTDIIGRKTPPALDGFISTGLGSLSNDLASVSVLPGPKDRALLTIQFLVHTIAYICTYSHRQHNDPPPPIRPDPPLPPFIPRSVPNPTPPSPNHLTHNEQSNTPSLIICKKRRPLLPSCLRRQQIPQTRIPHPRHTQPNTTNAQFRHQRRCNCTRKSHHTSHGRCSAKQSYDTSCLYCAETRAGLRCYLA